MKVISLSYVDFPPYYDRRVSYWIKPVYRNVISHTNGACTGVEK